MSFTKAVTLVLSERVTALKSSIHDLKIYEIKGNFILLKSVLVDRVESWISSMIQNCKAQNFLSTFSFFLNKEQIKTVWVFNKMVAIQDSFP